MTKAAPESAPTMLYREGSEIEWEGRNLDTCVVDINDADAVAEAKADGFKSLADILSAEPKAARKAKSAEPKAD